MQNDIANHHGQEVRLDGWVSNAICIQFSYKEITIGTIYCDIIVSRL